MGELGFNLLTVPANPVTLVALTALERALGLIFAAADDEDDVPFVKDIEEVDLETSFSNFLRTFSSLLATVFLTRFAADEVEE